MAFDPDSLDGRDPELIARLLPWVRAFNRHYLRLEVYGLDRLPRGPALFVGSHNGGIMGPDLFVMTATLWSHYGPGAPLYGLAHDFAMRQLTPLGRLLQRFGAVRACPENARRVLVAGGSAVVYPGGDLEAYRSSFRRDEIVLGERTGFVKVAASARAPIVPIVAYGAHRSAFIFTEGRMIARRLAMKRWARLERFPIALALPWGLALGPWVPYLPLPFPIRLEVLAPIDPAEYEDPVEVREEVRRRMQRALDELRRRESG